MSHMVLLARHTLLRLVEAAFFFFFFSEAPRLKSALSQPGDQSRGLDITKLCTVYCETRRIFRRFWVKAPYFSFFRRKKLLTLS